MSNPITEAYVFAQGPAGSSVLAGKLAITRTSGTFAYSEQWLEESWAYPLDPVNLKLTSAQITTRNENKVFPVFSDAGPDDWGTKVLLLGHSRSPANELERLVATSGHGVGCLQFSLSRTRPKSPTPAAGMELLAELEEASQKISLNQRIDPKLLEILIPATTMGGARPKVTLQDNGVHYLAKFSKPADLVNMPVVEFATLQLARLCKIDVPNVSLRRVGVRDVFLIERFDSVHNQQLHYISIHSLFNRDRIRIFDNAFNDPCSYVAIGKILRSHARDWSADIEQLYRRIVFNVIMGNIDDHGRNHGCLYDPANPGWRLSPAFDIVPTLSQNREHALGIGAEGRRRSMSNVKSAAVAFGLSTEQASNIINEISQIASEWRDHFRQAGVSQLDITLLEEVIGKD